MTKLWVAGLIALIVAAFAFAGKGDLQDAQADRAHYCDQVAIWQADAARGISEHDRAGWPPFDGECK